MRVTRTTVPYGPQGIILCHPYGLSVKDVQANVHHGSLLLDITDRVKNDEPIRYETSIPSTITENSKTTDGVLLDSIIWS